MCPVLECSKEPGHTPGGWAEEFTCRWVCQKGSSQTLPVSTLTPPLPPYLGHSHGTLLSEGVVVQVDDTQQGVDGESLGQGCDTRVIDAILWHVDLLQSPNDL